MRENDIKNLPELLTSLHERNIPPKDYQLYINRFLEFKARERGIPLGACFELTPLCNLDCKMCYVHMSSMTNNVYDIVSLEKWKDVITQAHAMGMITASLTGGECLIHPHFKEIYLHLISLGVKVNILTNGLVLDGKILDFITEYKPKCIYVTLYGSSENAYERVTGHRVFHQIRNNILKIIERGINIQLSITPNRFMYEDAKALLQEAIDLGIPYHINSKLILPRDSTRRQLEDITSEQYIEIYKINNLLNGRNIPIGNTEELPEVNQVDEVKKGIWCGSGRSTFSMRWDGNIYPCNSIDDISESILTQEFPEAWKKLNKSACEYTVPRECPTCIYKDVCLRCIAMHKNSPDRTHCDNQICLHTKKLIQEGLISWT